jgi:hypothetical protein
MPLVRWQFRGDIPKTGPLEKATDSHHRQWAPFFLRFSARHPAPGAGSSVDAAFAPPDERIGFRRITLCFTLLPRGPQRHTEFRCLLIRGSYAPLQSASDYSGLCLLTCQRLEYTDILFRPIPPLHRLVCHLYSPKRAGSTERGGSHPPAPSCTGIKAPKEATSDISRLSKKKPDRGTSLRRKTTTNTPNTISG